MEKRVLPGNVQMKKALEDLDPGDPVEQLDGVHRVLRRPELPGLDGAAEPLALCGHEDVVVIVAGGGAIDRAQALDGLQRMCSVLGRRSPHNRGRQASEHLVAQPVRFGLERRIANGLDHPERIEPRRKVPEPPDRLRQPVRGERRLRVSRRCFADR